MYLLVAIVAIIGTILYLKWVNGYWTRRGVVQIEPELFFGNFRRVLMKKVQFSHSVLERYDVLKKAKVKHGGMYIFTKPAYTPMDPTIIKNIFQKDFHYFVNRGIYHQENDILTMNLVNMTDEPWKKLRSKLTPTFTSGKMKMMFETLVEKTKGLESVMQEFADSGDTCDIKDVLARFTTDIIGSCAFGIECNSLENPDNIFRQFGRKLFEPNILRFILVTLFPWSLLGFFDYKEDGAAATQFFSDLVRDTIKHRETNQIYRKDFMHLLLQLKNTGKTSDSEKIHEKESQKGSDTLTENEIIAQCFIFFVAGFETSSTTMTFALLELSQNQNIQDKLRDEIRSVLEKYDDKVTYEAVMEMQYLDKVINETLRKFPPIPALPRVCNKTYKVPGTDLTIEKGILVDIPVWGLHRDPDYYPNPEQFDPERFSEENKAKRPDFTFLPFGEGPRMCIGLRFGMLQAKVGLISLIRNFKFTLNKKTALPVQMEHEGVILTVEGGVWLDVKQVSRVS